MKTATVPVPEPENSGELLAARSIRAAERLCELRKAVETIPVLEKLPDLCIYATGSYGRLDASAASDIDLFFLHSGGEKRDAIPRLDKIRLDARILETAENLGFPPFANDGEYLNVHYLDDLLGELGGREDDWRNYFTARMLLLLESRPVFNEGAYERAITQTVGSYCRDYYDSEKDFRSIFLINDILRYWRTMCINYEHRRNKTGGGAERRNKHHLRNLKLKFSRMLICFSAVILLARENRRATPETLSQIIHLSPMRRLETAAEKTQGGEKLLAAVKEDYAWFLRATGKPPAEVLRWISARRTRDDAFSRARKFGGNMYRFITAACAGSGDIMRYLVL